MSDIHARRLLAATLSRGKRAWLCGLLILATPLVQLSATRTQQQKAIVIDDFESGALTSLEDRAQRCWRLVRLYERQDSPEPV